MSNAKWLILIVVAAIMPFMAGCFTSGGVNPLSDSSLAKADTQEMVVTSELEDPNILASRFSAPLKKKFTFAHPSHKIARRLRAGLHRAAGCLRVSLTSPSNTDHINITVSQFKVKNSTGQNVNLKLDPYTIDLLSPSDILSGLALPPGVYKNLTFRIDSGKVVKDGKEYPLIVPSRKVKFVGSFEIKDGYQTEVSISFTHRLIKVWTPFTGTAYLMSPVLKITSKLVEITTPVPPEVVDGDISGTVVNFATQAPLPGISVELEGTSFTATTDTQGKCRFAAVPQGNYSMRCRNPDFLERSVPVSVAAGEIAEVEVEMNPAVIQSTIGNTGWFSYEFPFNADANGKFAEVSMETPMVIDFASLNFVKAEIKFSAEYTPNSGQGTFYAYLSGTKQLTVLQDLGTWWVGNTGTLGSLLGEFHSASPALNYTLDVTEFVRNNPKSMYFLAARNVMLYNMRLTDIQLSIFYR
jgi:hypothetical protein